MYVWHGSPETPRDPHRPPPGVPVDVHVATGPAAPGQRVWLEVEVTHPGGGPPTTRRHEASWVTNVGSRSQWVAHLGAFRNGDRVQYEVFADDVARKARGGRFGFRVGAQLRLGLVWHQHQPIYKDTRATDPRGSHRHPWVRLHAVRDYVGMALLAAEVPGTRVTINLTPALLWQIDDLLEGGATDRGEEVTRKAPSRLDDGERAYVLRTFFDADHRRQVDIHERYGDLRRRRDRGVGLTAADLRDLQVWFNLAWCPVELRTGEVTLPSGESLTVRHLVDKGSGFGESDVEEVLGVHRRMLANVVPVHRALAEAGVLEVTTTPFFHPILPLLVDTDQATMDRPGAALPASRFCWPEDARTQVERAAADYERRFGRRPAGMWPAEGAVSVSTLPFYAEAGVRWIATDRGVLAASGRYGYDAEDPDVLCQPWRAAEQGDDGPAIFFRDTPLSDAIGFRYQHFPSPEAAVDDFLGEVRRRFIGRFGGDGERFLPVILDGENAWGTFPEDGRPFLRRLYRALAEDPEIATATPTEFLDGNPAVGLDPHPPATHAVVHQLHTGSWVDESASAGGVELGTWIGEWEENEAWRLLGKARAALAAAGASPSSHPQAFEAMFIAEGSDWFWWYGDDQDSGRDEEFDALFRMHLENVYRGLGQEPPEELGRHIVPRRVVWQAEAPPPRLQAGDLLLVRSEVPGTVRWWVEAAPGEIHEDPLLPVGGVMAGASRFQRVLGPFSREAQVVNLELRPGGGAGGLARATIPVR